MSLKAGNKTHSLKVNAVANTAKTVLSLIFPLITFPYISRVLGVNQVGKFNFSNSIISYFLLIAALGISTYAIREGTQYRDNRDDISDFASQMFSINIISSIISYAILFVCLLTIDRLQAYKTEILIFSIEIIATTIGIEWIYNIYEDFTFIAIRSFIFQCISLALVFIFVHKPEDLDKYVLITVVSQVGNNVLNWIHARSYCKIRFTFEIDWKKHFKPIILIFSTLIAITIYVSSDTTMMGFLINDNDYSTGLYYVSSKIYSIFKNVIVAFLVVMIPRFSLYRHQEGGQEKSSSLFNRLSDALIVVTSPMVVGIVILAPDIIHIVSGAEYLQASTSLRILMMACFFSLFAYLFANCVLIPNEREGDFFRATTVAAIVNIGLNFILIPLLKEVGASITTLLAELITMVMVYISSKKYIDFQFDKRDTTSSIIGSVVIAFICITLSATISNMLLRIALCVVLSIVFYYVILMALKNRVAITIQKYLTSKLKNINR